VTGYHKIAFIIQGMGIGGAEKFLVALMNYFCSIGFHPILFLLSNNDELVVNLSPLIEIHKIVKKRRFDIFKFKKIKELVLQENITTIFCVNTYAFFLTKIFLFFNQNIQFYLSLHSTIPISNKIYWQNMVYFRFVQKKDIIIYLCYAQKKYLEKKYFIDNILSTVIYNGIDVNYFNPNLFHLEDKINLKHQLQISDNDFIIVMVARLQEEKRHTDAFDALQYLHDHFKIKAHLLVVGTGNDEYVDYLNGYAKNLTIHNFIHFIGSQHDVRKYYFISDMFALTSASETFSIAALEAMAFNLPCSLTDVGGAREMIIDGVSGKTCIPEDILSITETWNYILTNQLKNSEIRNHVISQFTDQVMFQKYARLIS